MELFLWVAGWALIHLTWITTLLGLCAWGLRDRLRHRTASSRHAIALGFVAALMLALLVATPLTLAWTPGSERPVAQQVTVPVILPTGVGSATDPVVVDRVTTLETAPLEATPPAPSSSRTERATTAGGPLPGLRRALAWLWLVGAVWLVHRLLLSYWRTHRLVRRAQPLTDQPARALVDHVAATLGCKQSITIATTTELDSPGVFGVVRPTVLLPEALRHWSRSDLELVLFHELAHIRRRDWLGSAIQRVVECGLFFHPSTWWLVRWLRLERECCCDSIVVDHTGRPQAYARALLALSSPPRRPVALLSMSGNPLVDRVAHIFNRESKSMRTPDQLPVLALFLTVVSAAAVAANAQDPRPRQPRAVDPISTTRPVDPARPRAHAAPVVPGIHDPAADPRQPLGLDAPRADRPRADFADQRSRRYRVRAGDSLYSIAKRHYGESANFRRILDANPRLDAARLRVGQVIRLPGAKAQGQDVHNRVQELEVAVRDLKRELARLRAARSPRDRSPEPRRTRSKPTGLPSGSREPDFFVPRASTSARSPSGRAPRDRSRSNRTPSSGSTPSRRTRSDASDFFVRQPGSRGTARSPHADSPRSAGARSASSRSDGPRSTRHQGTVLHVDGSNLMVKFRGANRLSVGTSLAIHSGNTYKGEATVTAIDRGFALCRVRSGVRGQSIRAGDRCATDLGTTTISRTKSVDR